MTPETRAARDRLAAFLTLYQAIIDSGPVIQTSKDPDILGLGIPRDPGTDLAPLRASDLRLVLAALDRHERATDPSTWREPCNVALAHTNGEIRCQLAVSGPPPARYTGNRNHWEKHWHQDEHGQVRTWTDNESEG